MKSVLVGLCGLVAPGFAHGLMGQRRMTWVIFVLAYLAATAIALTVWALWVVVAIALASVVHAGLLHRRLVVRRAPIRWSWLDPLLAFVGMIVANILLRVFVVEAYKSPSTSMNPTFELGDHFFINKLAGAPTRGDLIVFRQPCTPEKDYIKRVIGVAGDTIEVRCTVVYLDGKPLARELVSPDCSYLDRDDQSDEVLVRGCSRYRETLDDASYEIFHDATQPTRDRDRTATVFGDFPEDATPRDCSNQDYYRGAPSEQTPARLVVTNEAPQMCQPHMHLVVPADSLFVMGDNRANSADSRVWGTVPLSHVKGRVTGRWLPLGRFGKI